jgi:undecaprenyl diphosphate synthase
MRHVDEIAAPGTPEREILEQIELQQLPRHVAIIMDGNGRWAGARNLPRVEGHRAGIRAVRSTVETVAALEIDVLTLYAFSTENWKRPRFEVLTLMGLLKEYLRAELETFTRNNLRFRPIGRLEQLDQSVQTELQRAVEATSACTGPVVQIALNYSGRQELLGVVGEAVGLARAGELECDDLSEDWVSDHLATSGLPDPDLLIRTSGEQRVSNFLLWQLAYAEIYFTRVLWPDFSKAELLRAILDYQRRDRRFGGLSPSERIFSPSGAPDAGS